MAKQSTIPDDAEALSRINACRRKETHGNKLDLSNLGLTTLSPKIGQLTALTELRLSDNQLTTLPPEIGQLTGLTELYLSDNQLTTLPPEFGQLMALTALNLGSNQLTTLPTALQQLTALRVLELYANHLTAIPDWLGNLRSLETLVINANKITDLPNSMADLQKLRELYLGRGLGGCPLGILPSCVGSMRRLAVLEANDCQLKSVPDWIGGLSELSVLDLSDNQLRTLQPEIGQLTALRELHLFNNQLTTLPPEIGQLAALTELRLPSNQLTTLPPEIGQLTDLTALDLSDNQLMVMPPQIGKLTALTELNLPHNKLTTLPPEIGQLTALMELHLADNLLTALPPEIGQLAALTTLRLGSNHLRTLPSEIGQLTALATLDLTGNKLTALSSQLRKLPKLERLFLNDNPALQLSPTVLGADPRRPTEGRASAKSILDFYFGRQTGIARPLNEVKLILVGRGGAGKTSTVQALHGEPFREGEKSTPGIALCDWTMDGCKGDSVTAHVWDFAGQVITHALHQFFFSVRSVYVVVLTGRENNEREDAEYWLRLIKAFGTDDQGQGPPVIVALNKWDVPGCRPRVDRGALQERYSFIRGFVEMDCKSKKGIPKLKTALCREVDRLKWVRDPFPETWDAVRRALSRGKKKRAHLTYAEYRALCVKHGVEDEGQQDSLAEVLHNLGAALTGMILGCAKRRCCSPNG